jgi:AcrR family transcriptional regulator
MFDEPIDFKEQMAETRRMQILMGAAQVFAEKGYHQATTKEIAKAAGVSEGTIYNYFENKRELLVTMVNAIGIQSVKSIMADDPPEDPKEFLTAVLKDRYQIAKEFGNRMAPIIAEMLTDEEMRETVYNQIAMPIAGYVENFVQTNIEAGRFRQVDPVVATRYFVGGVFVNFALKLSGVDKRYNSISEDELIEQLISNFLNGLLSNENDEQ